MSYKPKFCAECGEKIERVEWQLLTSRRFCDDCAQQFENSLRWRNGIIAVSILIIGVFAGQIRFVTAPKVVTVANAQALIASSPINSALPIQNNKAANQAVSVALNANTQTIQLANQTQINPPPVVTVQTEASYYCGAKTQKGNICTRRVKGGGRCWQHIGKPALLPQAKLLIQAGNSSR